MHVEDILGLLVPVTYLTFYVTEKLWPARSFPTVSWWGALGVVFMIVLLTIGVVTPVLLPVEWLASHRWVDGTRLGVAGGVIVGLVALELVVYGYHRLCHHSPLLWRFSHQMHHAPPRVDIPGSVVFHPIELLIQNVLAVGVTVLVLGLDPLAAAIVGYALTFLAMFQHWNVRTPRWIGYLVQRPEAHCHHHELHVHAFNYADLPLWDMVFGTFRNPPTFDGRVGFETPASLGKMLIGIDVHAGLPAGRSGTPSRRTVDVR